MAEKVETTINQRFRLLRLNLALSQKEIADELGLVQATVSAIEKDRQTVTGQTVELLNQKFKVNKEWMFSGTGEIFQKSETEVDIKDTWREEAYTEVKSRNSFLEKEVERLWQMIGHLTGNKKPNFLKALDHAGLHLIIGGGERSGAQAAA